MNSKTFAQDNLKKEKDSTGLPIKQKNRYFVRSRISEAKFRQLIRLYALDLEATKIATLTGLSRNTINKILKGIRIRLKEECEQSSPLTQSVAKSSLQKTTDPVAETTKKIPVFGLFKYQTKVYTQIVPNLSRADLRAIVRGKVSFDSIVHSSGWKAYNALVDFGYKKHYRVNHLHDEFSNVERHISEIENFWSVAKMRLGKFRGLSKETFILHLKETEFRFNHRNENLYLLILKILREHPIKLS